MAAHAAAAGALNLPGPASAEHPDMTHPSVTHRAAAADTLVLPHALWKGKLDWKLLLGWLGHPLMLSPPTRQ